MTAGTVLHHCVHYICSLHNFSAPAPNTTAHLLSHTHTDTHSRSEKLGFTRTNTTDVERRIKQGGKMEGEAAREQEKA